MTLRARHAQAPRHVSPSLCGNCAIEPAPPAGSCDALVEKGPVLTAGSRPRGLTFYVFLSYIRKLCLLIYHSSPTID